MTQISLKPPRLRSVLQRLRFSTVCSPKHTAGQKSTSEALEKVRKKSSAEQTRKAYPARDGYDQQALDGTKEKTTER